MKILQSTSKSKIRHLFDGIRPSVDGIQTQYKPNFKGGIINKKMNIEVEVADPASV